MLAACGLRLGNSCRNQCKLIRQCPRTSHMSPMGPKLIRLCACAHERHTCQHTASSHTRLPLPQSALPTLVSTASRVVPLMSHTMERSSPAMAFSRLLLPAVQVAVEAGAHAVVVGSRGAVAVRLCVSLAHSGLVPLVA